MRQSATISLITVITVVTVVALAAGPAGAHPKLNKDQVARLERGEVLNSSEKVKGSSVMMGEAIGLFEDVPEAVVYVLLDVAKYKHFMPRVTDSRVVKQRGWHTFAVVETDLPWPVKDTWAYLKFTRTDKPGRVFEIKWWMINGTLKQYTGSALVEPWDENGNRALLTYKLLAEPRTAAPDSVISKGVKDVAEVFVKRLRLRLKALRTFKKLPAALRRK